MYAANFDNLRGLLYKGTDVVCVEKQGPVIKMMPFTENNGVAFPTVSALEFASLRPERPEREDRLIVSDVLLY